MNELNTSFLERQNKNTLARRILQEFSAVLKCARLYPPDHPFFAESLRSLLGELEGAFAKENPLVFNLAGKELYFGPVALVEDSLAQRQIAKELASRKIFRLVFRAGILAEELQKFVLLVAKDPGKPGPEGSLPEALKSHSLPHIEVRFGEPAAAEGGTSAAQAPTGTLEKEKRKKAERLYGEGVQIFSQLISGIQARQGLALSPVEALLDEYVGAVTEDETPLLHKTVVRGKSWDTSQHALSVCILSLSLGKMLGLNPAQLAALGEAALLHDIGTALVPAEILEKQGDLTEKERQLFEKHPIHGAALLQRVPSVSGITLRVALEHHWRQDGTGYPSRSRPTEPHPFSSLVSICDFYDAALSLAQKNASVYPAKAIAYMWTRQGACFEPACLKAFIQLMGIYPVGSLVQLEGGEVAVVTRNHPRNLHRPVVRLIPPSTNEPSRDFNLLETSDDPGKHCHSIREALSPLPFHLDPSKYLEMP